MDKTMTKETKDALFSILSYIAKNQEVESSFAYPNPQSYVFRNPLLSHIISLGLNEDEAYEFFNSVVDTDLAERNK